MANQLEDSLYDDEAAVRFIQSHLPQEVQGKYEDDDIVLITDTMVEYYERNGWLDADQDEEINIDVEELVAFVSAQLKKDSEFQASSDPEMVRWVVEAELDYEESLA